MTWHHEGSVTEEPCMLHNAPCRLHEMCARGCNDCLSSRVLVPATQQACHALPLPCTLAHG